MVDGLTALPAHRLAALVRAREVSAAEVLAAHLDRLEAVNPRLNAVVQVAPDAIDRAAAADAALARGERPGPLHGVPFTAKDNLETRGRGHRDRGAGAGRDGPGGRRHRGGPAAGGRRDPARQDQLPALGRPALETDQPGLRPHGQPLRPGQDPGRQQRRRGRGGGRRPLAVRPGHRLGREPAGAGPLLRRRRPQADRRAGPGHRSGRRRGADRGPQRPPHPARPDRPHGRGPGPAPRRARRPRRPRRRGRPGPGRRPGRGPDRGPAGGGPRRRRPGRPDRRHRRHRGGGRRTPSPGPAPPSRRPPRPGTATPSPASSGGPTAQARAARPSTGCCAAGTATGPELDRPG